MILNPQGTLQQNISFMFKEVKNLISKEDTREQKGLKVYQYMSSFMKIPDIYKAVRDYLTPDLLEVLKYEMKGSRTTLSPDFVI